MEEILHSIYENENTKELISPKEILYIANDKRDLSFFDPLAANHDI